MIKVKMTIIRPLWPVHIIILVKRDLGDNTLVIE